MTASLPLPASERKQYLYFCCKYMPFRLTQVAWKVWHTYQELSANLAIAFSKAKKPYPTQYDRILLVCTGLVGDSVMSIPFLEQLRAAFPQARIGMLARPAQKELFAPLQLIDEFFIHPTGLPLVTRWSLWKAWRRIYRETRNFRPQVGIILLGGEWLPLLARIGTPIRIDSDRSRFPRLTTCMYSFPNPRYLSPSVYLSALSCIGVTPDMKMLPRLHPAEEAVHRIRQRLAELGIQRYAVLSPQGITPNRSLSPQKVQTIANLIASNTGLSIILTGAKSETMHYASLNEKVYNWIGQTTLSELVALIAQSTITITMDTGTLHIAGALSVPTIGLFRKIRPEYASLYPTVQPVFWRGGEACLPGCSWDSWYGCAEAPCRQLEEIAPEDILAAIEVVTAP